MKRRTKILLIALITSTVLVGVACIWLAPPATQTRRLADGSTLELRRVDFGQAQVAYPNGSGLDRALFRLLPKSMRQPAMT